ncbi:uncharacterized protein EI90DRAFT_3075696 [Cantharellus anzutake]|uniref:uncharacterized protein n=1 Tax=Cantharellus anzutake TaxID=1750568 RepID=UPI001904EE1E|nr:uncharacterized protein EI90DRAFT_3075696 [Cantharellus anzutake]KAF8324288.1 hypothetical protein EI90DRAFT_3075696 [Cantharellus anzutake]
MLLAAYTGARGYNERLLLLRPSVTAEVLLEWRTLHPYIFHFTERVPPCTIWGTSVRFGSEVYIISRTWNRIHQEAQTRNASHHGRICKCQRGGQRALPKHQARGAELASELRHGGLGPVSKVSVSRAIGASRQTHCHETRSERNQHPVLPNAIELPAQEVILSARSRSCYLPVTKVSSPWSSPCFGFPQPLSCPLAAVHTEPKY